MVIMCYVIAFMCATVFPMYLNRELIKRSRKLDKEDEILHELTACRED